MVLVARTKASAGSYAKSAIKRVAPGAPAGNFLDSIRADGPLPA